MDLILIRFDNKIRLNKINESLSNNSKRLTKMNTLIIYVFRVILSVEFYLNKRVQCKIIFLMFS